MAKYQYVDSAGNLKTGEFASVDDAMKAPDIAKNSGVSLLQDTPAPTRSLNTGTGSSTKPTKPIVSEQDKQLSDLNTRILGTLSSELSNLGSSKSREKTIMQKFADRKTLAGEGGKAERALIEGESQEDITSQLENNARSLINFNEQGRGFATQKVAMDYLADTGKKRIRELEKARDSLLLQSKVAEATRLDNLIAAEEEAITNARTSFVQQLTNIGSEVRNIASFETPEQARRRELEVSKETADYNFDLATKQAVQNLAVTAPDAGITALDTYESAIAKYRQSATYKRNERAGELEIKQLEANIANTYDTINKRSLSGGSGGSSGVIGLNSSGAYSSDLDAFIGNIYNTIPSENGKKAFEASLKNARTDADKINAAASAILANSPADIKKDFISQAQGVQQIDKAIAALENGVSTGVLNSGLQYTYNIFGKDYDPKLAEINQLITSAIQPYRSSITGAAWGDQEDAEYEQLFGNTRYSPQELLQRLRGVKQIMLDKSTTALSAQVNPFGANVFEGYSFGGGNSMSTSQSTDAFGWGNSGL